jgi:hypothetical protein
LSCVVSITLSAVPLTMVTFSFVQGLKNEKLGISNLRTVTPAPCAEAAANASVADAAAATTAAMMRLFGDGASAARGVALGEKSFTKFLTSVRLKSVRFLGAQQLLTERLQFAAVRLEAA